MSPNDTRQNHRINWIEDMKMNAGHLIAQDNAFLEALHQIAAINICPIRYGLLPEKSGNPNFDMNLTVDHIGNIDVLINRC